MFCPKCGKELPQGAKFCSGCGTSLSQPSAPQYQAAPQAPSYPTGQRPTKPRRGKKALLAIPAVVIVALATLVVFNFTAIAARVSPDYALDRGFQKLGSVLEKKTNENNFNSLLPALAESFQEGTLSFSGELSDPNYGDPVTFSGELLTGQNEFLLQNFTASVSGESINPLSFYLSNAACAVSSSDLTGNNGWYGLYLDRPLAEQIPDSMSVSAEEIAQVQAQLDSLLALFNKEETENSIGEALTTELKQVYDDFLNNSKPSVSNESVQIVNSKVNVTVLTYHFTMQDIAALTDKLFDVLLKEEYVTYLTSFYSFSAVNFAYGTGIPEVEMWTSQLEEVRQEIVSTLRTDTEGNVDLAFALASDGTLVKVSYTYDVADAYSNMASVTCSFATDPTNGDFAVTLDGKSNGTSLYEASLICATTNQPDDVNQTLSLNFTSPYTNEENSIVLSSNWNPSTQDFSSSLIVTSEGMVVAQLTADGMLAVDSNSLILDLDTISGSAYDSYWNDGLTELFRGNLHLSAKAGSSISVPNFENIFTISQNSSSY